MHFVRIEDTWFRADLVESIAEWEDEHGQEFTRVYLTNEAQHTFDGRVAETIADKCENSER